MNRSCNTTNTKVMPGRALRSHGVVTAAGEDFMLNVWVKLTPEQVRDLVPLCDTRILQYEQSYGKKSICGTAGFCRCQAYLQASAVPGAQEDKGKV
jgi:hypothetical protein